MKIKNIIVSVLILLFRLIDLYTTQLGIKNFQKEEQNLIVKLTTINLKSFFIIEIILAILLITCYLFYTKYRTLFIIKAHNLNQYVNLYLFNKSKSTIKDWLINLRLKNLIVLLGSIIPSFTIITSILFSLNNYWVYLFNIKNKTAIKYYLLLNDFYLFDFIIFIFPTILIIFLSFRKIQIEYTINNPDILKVKNRTI